MMQVETYFYIFSSFQLELGTKKLNVSFKSHIFLCEAFPDLHFKLQAVLFDLF